jgi:hypothetical protein
MALHSPCGILAIFLSVAPIYEYGGRLDVPRVNANPHIIKLEPLIMPGSLRQAAPEIPFKTR